MTITTFTEAADREEADIVIVGAGISGLYCALRLLQDDASRRIVIVERLNRTGGRLDTDIIEISEGQWVREEQGGMRFNYGMTQLMNLNKLLGLCDQIVPFPMSSPGDTNRYHLRGSTFTKANATEGCNRIWGQIYDLNETERGQSPAQIVMQAFSRVLEANNDTMKPGRTPEEWTTLRETYTWKGRTLNTWQMWGLLRDIGHSEECIQMLTETIGFAGPFKGPINAGGAFQILADFPVHPVYYTFEHGFSTLPNAVEKKLDEEFPGRVIILLSTNVDTITKEGDEFHLSMTHSPEELNSNPYIPHGETKTAVGKSVILAVATSGMERLFQTSPALNHHPEAHKLWGAIHASRGMKLMKINLYFEKPWWHNGTVTPPVEFGPNFSSLPVNAVYPFYSIEPPTSVDEAEAGETDIPDRAAALTIYCDFNNTNFWMGLQNLDPPFTSELQEKQNAKRPQDLFAASRAVVDEAKRQLGLLFGVDTVPEPVLTSYRLWNGTDDFEYAYHQWRLNVVDSEVREYLAEPITGIHFCNEAISDVQGWVEGAIRSCDTALKKYFIDPLPDDPCSDPQTQPSVDSSAPPQQGMSGLWS